MNRLLLVICAVLALANPGCLILAPAVSEPEVESAPNGAKDKENGPDKNGPESAKSPKTLFQWAVGPEQPEEDGEEEEEPLAADRPDTTESSTNVGRGRIQLESGYTYTRDKNQGVRTHSHSYPELLLRVGVLADWLELRVGQNFGNERTGLGPGSTTGNGAEDLYLGIGLALTEQKGWLPESRLILQANVPTGSDDFTDEEVLPGFNYCYGWDVLPDCLTAAGSTGLNRSRDDVGNFFTEVSQTFTVGFSLTKKLGMYHEWFAFFPSGAIDGVTGPEHYYNSGLTYRINNNLQLDIRAGVGLNRHADDFFTGAGFAWRY